MMRHEKIAALHFHGVVSVSSEPVFRTAFYKFVLLDDPGAVVAQLHSLTQALTGRILVAAEGSNGILATAYCATSPLDFTHAFIDKLWKKVV